jgi:hypothetical protein
MGRRQVGPAEEVAPGERVTATGDEAYALLHQRLLLQCCGLAELAYLIWAPRPDITKWL